MSGKRKLSFDINLLDDEHITEYALSTDHDVNAAPLGGVSALDHLDALGSGLGSITSEFDNVSKGTANEGERRMLLGLGGGRDRLDSWGAMSDLSLNNGHTGLLGASAVLTELANDVCNVAAALDIPSPLDSPKLTGGCPDTPPLAPLSSNPNDTDINTLVANAVASLNQQLAPASLNMGVTVALQAQESLLATSQVIPLKPTPPPAKRKHKFKSSPVTKLSPATILSSPSGKGQSNQKWEEMFQALTHYIEQQADWDGNVPTHYKTKDGKALGRWVGNQRAAKHKGLLKPDRLKRLESTGLKWTVLSTNAWTDMMQELRLYVMEKTKDGQVWNGNVPTNYKIKSNTAPDGTEIDEEKNLGRWINRQRSLYQSNKLKKDRQRELEKIGLKWSVLSTSTWETMYEALCLYVNTRNQTDKWDGNVPLSYKTNDIPPKNLGRWVNRQRMAYSQNRLCKSHEIKLSALGLKLSLDNNEATPKKSNITENAPIRPLLLASNVIPIASISHGNQFTTSTTAVVTNNTTPIAINPLSIPDTIVSLSSAVANNRTESHVNKRLKL